MKLWHETLDKIKNMEVINHDGLYTILINNEYVIKEFNEDKPFYLDTELEATNLMCDYQLGIDAYKIGRNKNENTITSSNVCCNDVVVKRKSDVEILL